MNATGGADANDVGNDVNARGVAFDLPFPLNLPDTTATDYPAVVVPGDVPATLQFILRASGRGAAGMKGVAEGGDPIGRLAYTTVLVAYDVDDYPVVDDWDDIERVERAVEAVNTLLEHYRDLAEQPLVRRVAIKHVMHFKLVEWVPGESEQRVRYYTRASGPVGMNQTERQGALAAALNARLARGTQPDFLRQLYLDVQARMELGEYRQAVVEFAVTFEAWLRRRLVEAYTLAGLSEPDIAEKFVTKRGFDLTVTEVARTCVPAAIGFDFQNHRSWGPWADAKDLRNRIVHGQVREVTMAEALSALDGFSGALEAIQAAMESLPGWPPD
jgi:hypothetical protein